VLGNLIVIVDRYTVCLYRLSIKRFQGGNMLKYLATALVAVVLPFSFAGNAEATRPVPGFHYKDECKNIPGKQPAYELVGTGPYRRTPGTKHDCYLWRTGK
jgi:hypothetical protein